MRQMLNLMLGETYTGRWLCLNKAHFEVKGVVGDRGTHWLVGDGVGDLAEGTAFSKVQMPSPPI